jgi:hypothetical protein
MDKAQKPSDSECMVRFKISSQNETVIMETLHLEQKETALR